jgi:hypothetical protein
VKYFESSNCVCLLSLPFSHVKSPNAKGSVATDSFWEVVSWEKANPEKKRYENNIVTKNFIKFSKCNFYNNFLYKNTQRDISKKSNDGVKV